LKDAWSAEQVITDDDLPETLPGFDIRQGLKRMQGNRRLYRKLLLDFASDYSHAADEIHQALAAGDINQVHSLVHNIKGLAGNLSATELQNCATAMDSSVKKALSGEEPAPGYLDPVFAEMRTALEEALASCQLLERPDDKKAGSTTAGPSVTLPPDLARETAAQLQTAADMGDIGNLKSIADGLKLKSASYAVFSDNITRMAENFDFEGILNLVDELRSSTEI
jgi:HPt (histidine-containing phosphotransfer) domain-containing protein